MEKLVHRVFLEGVKIRSFKRAAKLSRDTDGDLFRFLFILYKTPLLPLLLAEEVEELFKLEVEPAELPADFEEIKLSRKRGIIIRYRLLKESERW